MGGANATGLRKGRGGIPEEMGRKAKINASAVRGLVILLSFKQAKVIVRILEWNKECDRGPYDAAD